jgi:predicted dehydrogenase
VTARGISPDTFTVGVVGVGHLGTFHLQKYSSHPSVSSIIIHDLEGGLAEEKKRTIGSVHPVEVAETLEECLEKCVAVSIAVPTASHAPIVEKALEIGCHVLVEKPITSESASAWSLVEKAEAGGRILHVGHVERFNPALQELEAENIVPRFIEAHRLAPYNPRGTDVPVVLDLMVHDLDLILHLTGEKPVGIEAAGVPVITSSADIANVRLSFPSGCVANVTASRVSLSSMRKLRVFASQVYLSLDLLQGNRELVRLRHDPAEIGNSEISVMEMEGRVITRKEFQGERDALAMEIDSFLSCVRAQESGSHELTSMAGVSGREAATALELAEEITRKIAGT